MEGYFLARDSYVCETQGYAVFLDLKRDRYVALPPSEVARLREVLRGFSRTGASAATPNGETRVSEQAATLARMLELEGLLVRDESQGRACGISIETAAQTFRQEYRAWPELRARYVYDFATSWLQTSAMLRLMSIRSIVKRVQLRKESRSATATKIEMSVWSRMAGVFYVIQPLFYSAEGSCLRNSLTLIEFLARYNLYPSWVFGVRLSPFAAHCWVQEEKTILNDTLENVSAFTPLMVA